MLWNSIRIILPILFFDWHLNDPLFARYRSENKLKKLSRFRTTGLNVLKLCFDQQWSRYHFWFAQYWWRNVQKKKKHKNFIDLFSYFNFLCVIFNPYLYHYPMRMFFFSLKNIDAKSVLRLVNTQTIKNFPIIIVEN